MQTASAVMGSSSMAARLTLPLRKGSSHAPPINTSPGKCKKSRIIVIFAARQPHFAQQLGHHDDRDARNQSIHRPPGRNRLEPKMRMPLKKQRQHDLGHHHCSEDPIAPALDPREANGVFQLPFQKAHGMALPVPNSESATCPASFSTGMGNSPSSRLAAALIISGATIHGTSRMGSWISGPSSKYAL